jgi:hypothetical protein
VSTSAAAFIDRYARKRLRRHFDKIHWTLVPELLMFIGAMCPIFGLWHLDRLFDWVLLGTIMGVSGWVWRYWTKLYVASQKEFDHIAETDFTAAQTAALEAFELTAADLIHAEPCKFRNPGPTPPTGFSWQAFLRVGSDEKPRRSPHEYLIVNFGKSHLLLFRCVWDLTSGTTLSQETSEFAYHDIASVLMTHRKETLRVNMRVQREIVPLWKAAGIVPINDKIHLPGAESVALLLVNGDPLPLFAWKRSGGGIPSGEGKKSWQNAQRLQKLLREQKQQREVAVRGASGSSNQAPPTIRDVGSSG